LDSSFSVDFCRSVTVRVVGNHIFSDYFIKDFLEVFQSVRLRRRLPESRKIDLPEIPLRIRTLGEELPVGKSISYHADDSKLFTALWKALHADEYEELKELVHYMLGFQLDIKKKYELWSLVGPQPVT
ncbi:unnamed protein product, partial [Brassica oleracea]